MHAFLASLTAFLLTGSYAAGQAFGQPGPADLLVTISTTASDSLTHQLIAEQLQAQHYTYQLDSTSNHYLIQQSANAHRTAARVVSTLAVRDGQVQLLLVSTPNASDWGALPLAGGGQARQAPSRSSVGLLVQLARVVCEWLPNGQLVYGHR